MTLQFWFKLHRRACFAIALHVSYMVLLQVALPCNIVACACFNSVHSRPTDCCSAAAAQLAEFL
eukprot:1905298-Karenia_brevis.AAC.1